MISWTMDGRQILEGSKNASSSGKEDGQQEQQAHYLDFITAVCHCLAQAHVM